MKTSRISLLAALPLLAAMAANAQQLNQPNRVQPAPQPSSATKRSSNTLAAPASSQNGPVSSDPAQRSRAPMISSKGPATDANRPAQPSNISPQAPTRPPRVTDASGRLVNGAVQVGPNRVMDPATGRFYTTMPDGDGVRIVEPRPKK